jgi:hypothetical protein
LLSSCTKERFSSLYRKKEEREKRKEKREKRERDKIETFLSLSWKKGVKETGSATSKEKIKLTEHQDVMTS